MAVMYYGSHISENLVKSPEGYLFCYGVPINRTGTQVYSAGELGLSGDPERPITVYRMEEDVFAPAAMASFEGKDVTRGHPPEMLSAGNQAGYSKGHLENVRREGDNTVADLIIKDPALVSDVENGVLREVSCGYNCNFEPYQDGYKQTHIIGNHVAVVPKGRAGAAVAIHDQAAGQAEKGLKRMKKETKEALYRFFGLAANDAAPEELEQLTKDVTTVASVLDEEPAGETPALDEEPTEQKAGDEVVYKEQEGADLGSKIDRLLELMEGMARHREERMHDETDIDKAIEKLAGEGEGEKKAVTIPVEEADACTGPARDAAVELLRRVRPAVAAIEDKATRAKVTDALLSAIQGEDMMAAIANAAQDSAEANAKKTQKTNYEQVCEEVQSAYAARNPHMKKED